MKPYRFRDLVTGEIRTIGRARRSENKNSNCRCHHPKFSGAGPCTYRTCRHPEEIHYGTKLPYDNKPLADGDFWLTNVEAEITKHPSHFVELDELINWINKGIARCNCGFPIRREDLRYYRNHDNGLLIPFEDSKCWIFSLCPRCGYAYNFQKIMRQKNWYEEVKT
jgi:hypothetical protein